MGQGWKERCRKAARWCVALLLIPLGALSDFLFLYTGRPLPTAVKPPSGSDAVENQSACGKFVAVITKRRADEQGAVTIDYSIRDRLTRDPVGEVAGLPQDYLNFTISPDGRVLVVSGTMLEPIAAADVGNPQILHRVFKLPSGLPVPIPGLGEARHLSSFDSSADGNVLVASFDHATANVWDTRTGFCLNSFKLPGAADTIARCFFDRGGRPKALAMHNKQPQMWDVQTGLCDWDMTGDLGSKPESRSDSGLPIQSVALMRQIPARTKTGTTHVLVVTVIFALQMAPDNDLFAVVHPGHGIGLYSLGDGNLKFLFTQFKDMDFRDMMFSPDGRYLLIAGWRPHPLIRFCNSLGPTVSNYLVRWISPHVSGGAQEQTLIDLEAGKTWPRIPGNNSGNSSLFATHGGRVRLVTFDDQKVRYDWDVPPRWQWFTPWTWAAVGAWLGLAVFWRRLRKRQPRPATVA